MTFFSGESFSGAKPAFEPPDATKMMCPSCRASSGSLGRTLRTGSTFGRCGVEDRHETGEPALDLLDVDEVGAVGADLRTSQRGVFDLDRDHRVLGRLQPGQRIDRRSAAAPASTSAGTAASTRSATRHCCRCNPRARRGRSAQCGTDCAPEHGHGRLLSRPSLCIPCRSGVVTFSPSRVGRAFHRTRGGHAYAHRQLAGGMRERALTGTRSPENATLAASAG